MNGIIKNYNNKKGYGFISCSHNDIFFHISDFSYGIPTPGMYVSFDLKNTSKGKQAINITLQLSIPMFIAIGSERIKLSLIRDYNLYSTHLPDSINDKTAFLTQLEILKEKIHAFKFNYTLNKKNITTQSEKELENIANKINNIKKIIDFYNEKLDFYDRLIMEKVKSIHSHCNSLILSSQLYNNDFNSIKKSDRYRFLATIESDLDFCDPLSNHEPINMIKKEAIIIEKFDIYFEEHIQNEFLQFYNTIIEKKYSFNKSEKILYLEINTTQGLKYIYCEDFSKIDIEEKFEELDSYLTKFDNI